MVQKDDIERLRSVNLVDFLTYMGVPIIKKGREYIHADHDSLRISEDKGWYWFSQGKGGNVIDYLMEGPDFNYNFRDATRKVKEFLSEETLGDSNIENIRERKCKKESNTEKKEIELTERKSEHKRVFAYLAKTRNIDMGVINHYIKRNELYEDEKGNAVFIGRNYDGKVAYATKRGTLSDVKYAMDVKGSDKRYGFRWENENSDKLRVFESPIDLMSYLTLQKMHNIGINDNYLSLGGVSLASLDEFLKNHKNIKTIVISTDNDEAGEKCFERAKALYGKKYVVKRHLPKGGKDWNDTLNIIKKNRSKTAKELSEERKKHKEVKLML